MAVNPKKPRRLRNKTNYFVPGKDKVSVTVVSPDSYYSRESKIEGYESRLFWQFRYCAEHGGQTFFYTLTYNDSALPRHYDMVCFDYEDLRDLLTGGFRKCLLRKYGTKFKYFVGAELGDGKGERGFHNNSHYHILFFLESADNPKFPYVQISSADFRHLIRLYWQGFDQDEKYDGFHDFREAKYGIAKEGSLNDGLVTDFRAVAYVAKYVCKDVSLVRHESSVEKSLRTKYRKASLCTDDVFKAFFREVIYPFFNTPLNASRTEWCFTDEQLVNLLTDNAYFHRDLLFGPPPFDLDSQGYRLYVEHIIHCQSLHKQFRLFVDAYIEPFVKEGISEWRNRFSNKCRISHGVGDYALEEMCKHPMNPLVQVPDKKEGLRYRPINLYYYRKMFCDVVKDKNGNNLYVLNKQGIEYKCKQLPQRIARLVGKVSQYLDLLLSDESLYKRMRDSDVNTTVFWSYPMLVRKVKRCIGYDGFNELLKRYAEYKLVYEDRFFEVHPNGGDTFSAFPELALLDDYKRFLVPSFFSVPRNDLRLSAFLENVPENYLPYSQHPYFACYVGVFSLLDLCADYFFVTSDDKKQKYAEEIAAVRRFHVRRTLKEYFSSLTFKK